jgi:hypothetical protein
VVLAFFHGLGLVLYLLGYLLLPADGEERSFGQRLVEGPDRHVTGGQALALVLLALASWDLLDEGPGRGFVVVVAVLLAVLWWQHRRPSSEVVMTAPPSPPEAVPPAPAAPSPASSPYTGLVLSAALLVAGVLLTVGASEAASVPAEVVLAAALAVVGLGLVLTSVRGSAPGLVVVAVLLTVGLGLASGLRPVVTDGVGDRTWLPTASDEFRLGVGDATLDLRGLPSDEAVLVDARVEVGHLVVFVPEDVHVVVDAEVRLGELRVFDDNDEGHDLSSYVETGPAGEATVTLRVSVRLGQLEVRRG